MSYSLSSKVSAYPIIDVIGVFNSCDTSATNSFRILSSFTCSVISCITAITPAANSCSSLKDAKKIFKYLSSNWTLCSEEVQFSRYIVFSKFMSMFNLLNILSNVFSFSVSFKSSVAAGFICIILPWISNAIIPSVMWSNIVSICLFCLYTSFKFSFNSFVIKLNALVNSSTFFLLFSVFEFSPFAILGALSINLEIGSNITFETKIPINIEINPYTVIKIMVITFTFWICIFINSWYAITCSSVCATSEKFTFCKLYAYITPIPPINTIPNMLNINIIFNCTFFNIIKSPHTK